MKSRKEIIKIIKGQFYEDILNFHISVLERNLDVRGFLKRKREIINKAVSSITEEKKKRKVARGVLGYFYDDIRDLHMASLREAISLNAFQKRKKQIIYNAVCSFIALF